MVGKSTCSLNRVTHLISHHDANWTGVGTEANVSSLLLRRKFDSDSLVSLSRFLHGLARFLARKIESGESSLQSSFLASTKINSTKETWKIIFFSASFEFVNFLSFCSFFFFFFFFLSFDEIW